MEVNEEKISIICRTEKNMIMTIIANIQIKVQYSRHLGSKVKTKKPPTLKSPSNGASQSLHCTANSEDPSLQFIPCHDHLSVSQSNTCMSGTDMQCL